MPNPFRRWRAGQYRGADRAEKGAAGPDGHGFRRGAQWNRQLRGDRRSCALRHRRSPSECGGHPDQFEVAGSCSYCQKKRAAMILTRARFGLSILAALLTAGLLVAAGLLMARYEDQLYGAQQLKDITEQARILAASVAAAVTFD